MNGMIRIAAVLSVTLCGVAGAATQVRIGGYFAKAGSQMAVTQVDVGDEVWLVVEVTDESDQASGIIGGVVDVAWNSGVLQLLDAIDTSEATTADVEALFDPMWGAFFSGVKAGSGALQDLGAGQAPPFERTNGQTVTFLTLRFKAIAAGQANVKLAGRGFGLFGHDEVAAKHVVENPSLLAVEPSSSPGQPTPNTPDPTAPAAGCFGPAMAVGLAMCAGMGGVFGRRRRQG
ncbi:MAG: hypothetical protein JXQ73_00410 [Phycisphaerae bacterium]|nr:hypothetical protein [Phycisphaerae bacterium]